MIPFLLVFGFLLFFGILYVVLYNRFVHARQKVQEALSGIDVQLNRRYELIPNLVTVIQAAATHEKNVLEQLIQARTAALQIPDSEIEKQAQAEDVLTGTLKSIFAVAENYPDLKTNTNFLKLQEELSETEDQIAASREIYNGNVTHFNILIQSFPSNIVAKIYEKQALPLFEFSHSFQETKPKVRF